MHKALYKGKEEQSQLKELRIGENSCNSWMNKEDSLGGKDRGVFIN